MKRAIISCPLIMKMKQNHNQLLTITITAQIRHDRLIMKNTRLRLGRRTLRDVSSETMTVNRTETVTVLNFLQIIAQNKTISALPHHHRPHTCLHLNYVPILAPAPLRVRDWRDLVPRSAAVSVASNTFRPIQTPVDTMCQIYSCPHYSSQSAIIS